MKLKDLNNWKKTERGFLVFKYKCSVCGGNCDPGELVGDICLDCLEEQRVTIVMQNKAVSLLNAPWEQMKLEFGGINSGSRGS